MRESTKGAAEKHAIYNRIDVWQHIGKGNTNKTFSNLESWFFCSSKILFTILKRIERSPRLWGNPHKVFRLTQRWDFSQHVLYWVASRAALVSRAEEKDVHFLWSQVENGASVLRRRIQRNCCFGADNRIHLPPTTSLPSQWGNLKWVLEEECT